MPNRDNIPLVQLDTQLKKDLWEHYAWREFKNGHRPKMANTYTHFNGYTVVYDEEGNCWTVEDIVRFKGLDFVKTSAIPSDK